MGAQCCLPTRFRKDTQVKFSRRGFLGAAVGTAAVGAIAGAAGQGYASGKDSRAILSTSDPLAELITPISNGWVLENDSIRVQVSTASGSITITSLYNKLAGTEYQTVANGRTLFEYEVRPESQTSSTVRADDGGWSIGQYRFVPLNMTLHSGIQPIGRAIEVDLTRTNAAIPLTVTAVFEVYEGETGIRFLTRLKNNAPSAKLTIVNSVVMAMGFANAAHTLHYPPNSWWKSTRGALSPAPEDTSHPGRAAEVPKKVICVYDSGDGWSFSPELNWKTQKGKGEFNSANQSMLPPWASINAWSGMQYIHLKTNRNRCNSCCSRGRPSTILP